MEVLPNVEKVQTLSTEGRAALLDRLFEPSTPLHTLCVDVLHENVYTSYYELIGAVEKQFNDLLSSSSVSDTKWLDSILSSHPRLGEKKIDSKQSAAEQAQLQSEEDDDDSLPTLNGQYESQFPGLRFVTFVNGRPRPLIKAEMKARIRRSDIGLERKENIKAMCQIAMDRVNRATSAR